MLTYARRSFGRDPAVAVLLIALTVAVLGVLELVRPSVGAAASGPVLVVVAHPDDEVLGMAGVIQQARSAGRRVYVAFATNGEGGGAGSVGSSYCGLPSGQTSGYAALALKRDGEALAAEDVVGVPAGDVFFLGYPDSKLALVGTASTSFTGDLTTLHRTFARAGSGTSSDSCNGDFHFAQTGQHALLTAAALADDMDRLVALTRPADVYTHMDTDGHSDHREVARQVAGALDRSQLTATFHGTLIHPAETDNCSTLSSNRWPNPSMAETGNDPFKRFTPTLDVQAPPFPACASTPTGTSWGPDGEPDEWVDVPAAMLAPTEGANQKWEAISKHASQITCTQFNGVWSFTCGYMRAFAKRREFFWSRTYKPTIAPAYVDAVGGTAGLSGWWRFGDMTGTRAEAAAGGVAGTYGAGITLGQPGLIANDPDTAAGFSGGSGAQATFGDRFDFAGTSRFTLEAWVKPTTLDASSRRIFSKETTDGNGYYLIATSAKTQFARLIGGSYQTLNAPALALGARTHVVLAYDGAVLRMYFNGTEVAQSGSSGALANSTVVFTVGAKSTGGSQWAGTIDEPAVYDGTTLTRDQVLAHYKSGVSGTSTPPPPADLPPSVPAGLTATAGDGRVTLDWADSSEGDLAGYRVYRRVLGGTFPGAGITAPTSAYTDTTAINGTTYEYRITAVDAAGQESAPTATVTATPQAPPPPPTDDPPAAPTGLTANAGDARVVLDWADNRDSDLAGYRVYRRVLGGTFPATGTTVTVSAYTDTTAINGTTYEYRITAVDAAGQESAPTATVTATPQAPPAGYANAIAGTPGVQNHWRFGEATGATVATAKVGTVAGTYGAGAKPGTAGLLTGDADRAATFDGSGSAKATFGNIGAFTESAAFSLEAWVRPSVVDATSRRIFSREWTDASGRVQGWYLVSNSARLQFARLRDGGYEVANGPALAANTRYHVVVTSEGLTQRLYVNGVQVGQGPATTPLLAGSTPFTVGAKAGGGGSWSGVIDEPALYNRALTAAQVLAHKQAG